MDNIDRGLEVDPLPDNTVDPGWSALLRREWLPSLMQHDVQSVLIAIPDGRAVLPRILDDSFRDLLLSPAIQIDP